MAKSYIDFWMNVDFSDDNSCWNWTGTKNHKGYGRTYWKGKNVQTHRLAYEMNRGKIDKSAYELSKIYGVSHKTLWRAKVGKTWKHSNKENAA